MGSFLHRAAVTLDETDFRIARAILSGDSFGWQPVEAGAGDLAKALGLHRNTVLRRLRRMEEDGTLMPMQFGVSPHLFGLVGGRVFVKTGKAALAAHVAPLFDVDGVVWALRHPDGVSVTLYAEDQRALDAKVRLVERLAGGKVGAWDSDETIPQEAAPLRREDARILDACLAGPDVRASAVARQVGASARTVERRLKDLRARRLVRMRPSRPLEPDGVALAYVRVGHADASSPQARASLDAAAPNTMFRFATPDALHVYLYGKSPAALERQAASLRSLPGASDVRCRRVLGFYLNPDVNGWMRTMLSRRAVAA